MWLILCNWLMDTGKLRLWAARSGREKTKGKRYHSTTMQRVWSTYLDTSAYHRPRSTSPGQEKVGPDIRGGVCDADPSVPFSLSPPTSSRRKSLASTSDPQYLVLSSFRENRRDSVNSHATSTRHMLADDLNTPLEPPSTSFPRTPSLISLSKPNDATRPPLPVSLSINYLPSKFSAGLLSPSGSATRRRKGLKGVEGALPKRGGGVEAFRSGEARMPGQHDEDYDGVSTGWFGGKHAGSKKSRLRWNRFKWFLFFANILVSAAFSRFALCSSSLPRSRSTPLLP
jgi:hypothetical protein